MKKPKTQKNQHTLKYLEKAEALPGEGKLDNSRNSDIYFYVKFDYYCQKFISVGETGTRL